METKDIGRTWMIAILGILIVIGSWFAYWKIALAGADNRYEVNTKTQQYQAGIVAGQRARVSGYDNAVDPAQKKNIAQTFCSMEATLTQVPADLAAAYERIC